MHLSYKFFFKIRDFVNDGNYKKLANFKDVKL